MAGKIALGILGLLFAGFLGYRICLERVSAEAERKSPELPFRVAAHVMMGKAVDGTPAPYTLVNYERRIQKLIPGVVSTVGEEILIQVEDEE
jgi:hypothetical protein